MANKIGTYDETLPTDKDKVRALIPDTVPGDYLISDAQILLTLTLYSDNVIRATAECCGIIAADLARYEETKAITVGGNISVTASQASKMFKERQKTLDERASGIDSAYYDVSAFDYYVDKYGNDGSEYWGDIY